MSWVDSDDITSTEVVNKEHKKFTEVVNWNNNISSFMLLTSYHGMIIMGPGQNDYHGFMIIILILHAVFESKFTCIIR